MTFAVTVKERTKPMNLEWNIWRDELNTNKIQPFNVFNHCSFRRAVLDIFNYQLCMDEFEEIIDKEAMYYFWCKAEYEVMVGGLFERLQKTKAYMLRTNKEFIRECSQCKSTFNILEIDKPVKYCPCCGRKFGEKNE